MIILLFKIVVYMLMGYTYLTVMDIAERKGVIRTYRLLLIEGILQYKIARNEILQKYFPKIKINYYNMPLELVCMDGNSILISDGWFMSVVSRSIFEYYKLNKPDIAKLITHESFIYTTVSNLNDYSVYLGFYIDKELQLIGRIDYAVVMTGECYFNELVSDWHPYKED